MSNYRRLISYIYAYEGGVKGKNIGYAKVEVRSGQCRIYVSVKKVYVGRNDIGVYLLAPAAEIFLGRIFIRGGSGEFRITVAADKVDGKKLPLDQCYGLTIHDSENSWQSYTTIWEDAVAQAAEIELAEVTAENVRKQNGEGDFGQTGLDGYSSGPYGFPVSKEIERELEQEEARQEETVLEETALEETLPEKMVSEKVVSEKIVPKYWPESQLEEQQEEQQQEQREYQQEDRLKDQLEDQLEDQQKDQQKHPGIMKEEIFTDWMRTLKKKTGSMESSEKVKKEKEMAPDPEDPEKLAELDRQEQEQVRPNQFWNRMQQRYARVLAFDYDKGCEILSIKPQDIGLLPREIWVYGNNSFLLHGYYNYRHLILARLDNPQGEPRYLLGVPGHYFSNEKYMATMFGFPHFVIARKQPDGDGRFGYWYTDIRL